MQKDKGKLVVNGTHVFAKNYNAVFKNDDVRFVINQGGTRSSKTYSILQLLIVYAFMKPNSRIAIYRKYKTSHGPAALPDLVGILTDMNIFNQVKYNKSASSFRFANASIINFYGADDPQTLRGRKYDLVFLNEANELSFEDYVQINMRTKDKIILDFNPSDPFSWIMERLLHDEKAMLIKSTYLDNQFLPAAQVREIENLINVDDNYYRIYVLGELPIGNEFIFPIIHKTPFPSNLDYIYGMDFGFNDPTVIVKVAINDGKIYIKEEIHESWLNSEQTVERMRQVGISPSKFIYADNARPEMIDSIGLQGFRIQKCKKGRVKETLDLLRTLEIHIDPGSEKTFSEFRNYKYKKYQGRVTDEPQGFNDHSIDATRYAAIELKTPGPKSRIYTF